MESDSLLDTLELVAIVNKNQYQEINYETKKIRKTCILREHQSYMSELRRHCTVADLIEKCS